MTTYLLDTNVVVRLMEPSAPEYPLVGDAIRRLIREGHNFVLAPQVLTELWVVATRPEDVNGFGWAPAKTLEVIARLRARFPLLEEGPATFEKWLDLVAAGEIRGKRAHDARLAAVALVNGVSAILTLNVADFQGVAGFLAVHPSSISKG